MAFYIANWVKGKVGLEKGRRDKDSQAGKKATEPRKQSGLLQGIWPKGKEARGL